MGLEESKKVEERPVPQAQAALTSLVFELPFGGANLSLLYLMTKLKSWEKNGFQSPIGREEL